MEKSERIARRERLAGELVIVGRRVIRQFIKAHGREWAKTAARNTMGDRVRYACNACPDKKTLYEGALNDALETLSIGG